jgi:phenylacetate-coenzyme A ligase PaaK-like adenylate-forming protein
MKFEHITAVNLLDRVKNNFEETALSIFQYQYAQNDVYQAYVNALKLNPKAITRLEEIPFLPISFFKSHTIKSGDFNTPYIFESSGTTANNTSKHYIKDVQLYNDISAVGFESYFGPLEDLIILGLLPSYLERSSSSLVHMVHELSKRTQQNIQPFFLNNFEELDKVLNELKDNGKKIVLFGVTFALIDFANAYPQQLKDLTIIETGGMKGRKEEWTRDELHEFLKLKFGTERIGSEYGMTELLSQAYCLRSNKFSPITTFKPLIREVNDPLTIHTHGAGVLNIIDLANIHSCSFIATDDLGIIHKDNTFEVLGRLDFSVLRGCSLLVV